jgi:hypothetical protein
MHADSDKDRSIKEIEAESVAYTVCQHFGIETGDYSFGYLASWSGGDRDALKKSMAAIQQTAAKLLPGSEFCLYVVPKIVYTMFGTTYGKG